MRANWLAISALLGTLALITWLADSNRRLQVRLSRARSELLAPRTKSASTPTTNTAVTGAVPAKAPATTISADRWNDPVWKAARFNEAILQTEARYGRFFLQLKGWDPARLESLKQRMARDQVDLMRLAAPDSAAAMAADKKEHASLILEAVDRNNEELKGSLGEADYAKLEAFNETEPYRQSVDMLANGMRSKGVEVSGDLEESVLAGYAAALRDSAAQASAVDTKSLTPEQRSDLENQSLEAFHTRLVSRMSGILNEKQLNALMETALEQDGSAVNQ